MYGLVLGWLSGCNVAMWFVIRLWPCILLALVVYLCSCEILPDFPCYGCISGVRASVLYGMTLGRVLVGFFVARPWVMVA